MQREELHSRATAAEKCNKALNEVHIILIETCIVDEEVDVLIILPQALPGVRSKAPHAGGIGKVQPPALAATRQPSLPQLVLSFLAAAMHIKHTFYVGLDVFDLFCSTIDCLASAAQHVRLLRW